MECELCSGTGYEPCDNCGEHDCGLNGNRVCVIDGEEYGASPCGQGCTPPHGLDPDYALGESHTAVYEMDMGLLTDGTLADLGRRLDLVLRIAAQMKEARDALETALIEMMPEDTLTMDGIRVVRERAARSAWKPGGSARMREDITHTVATKLATEVMTGEVDPMRRNLISNAIAELFDKVLPAPSAMKAGAKTYGLRISEYRDFTDGYNISVVPLEEGL